MIYYNICGTPRLMVREVATIKKKRKSCCLLLRTRRIYCTYYLLLKNNSSLGSNQGSNSSYTRVNTVGCGLDNSSPSR